MTRLGTLLRRTGIICAVVCWFSSSVTADPIRITSNRLVEGGARAETPGGTWETGASDNTSLPGLFNVVINDFTPPDEDEGGGPVASFIATQHTDVSASRWSGAGTAQTWAIPWRENDPLFGFASAQSHMLVEFTLAEPMSYWLAGTITGAGGFSAISLEGPTGLGWIFESGDAVPLVAMRRGLLSPGDYLFWVRATSYSDSSHLRTGRSVFDVQFTLTDPVPEPATLLLFGTGVAFVGRAAWRRRREQSVTGSSDPIADI